MSNQQNQTSADVGRSELSGPVSHGISLQKDMIAEKLDEMADLCEYWKRNRERGRNPSAIRAALMMLADELTLLRAADKIPPEILDSYRHKIGG